MIKYPFALKLRTINEFSSRDKKLEQLARDLGVEDVSLLQ
jgi:transposase-like protein